jgi:hypothetical protein
MIKQNYTRGFIAISSVLILSAIFLSISIGMALRAISGADATIGFHERETARLVAHGCLDYARMELQRTLDYVGNEGILIGSETCEIFYIEGSGNNNRILMVESIVGKHTVRIKEVIEEISPNMRILSSERVVSF